MAEQRRRAEERTASHALRYPVAPTYSDMPSRGERIRLGRMSPVLVPYMLQAALRLMLAKREAKR